MDENIDETLTETEIETEVVTGDSSSFGETAVEGESSGEASAISGEGAFTGDALEITPYSSFEAYAVIDPVTSSDANGLKAIMLDLLGDYEGVVVEYAYENNNGYTSYVREVQPDYPWLISAAVFCIVLYCVFRLGAKVLCNR